MTSTKPYLLPGHCNSFGLSRHQQTGVGLMEVLVAVALLAIGFLAAAKMQVESMHANHTAYQSAQALITLSDMMDRMGSNPESVAAGLYNNKTTGTLTEPTCVSLGCTDAELAAVDMFEWSASFQSLRGEIDYIPLLPPDSGGDPAVGHISAPINGVYTLSVTWERRNGENLVDETVSVQFLP